ncbi:hypothetical protein BV22DRAFT_1044904 [Leucogyrophana mollusca]|uniref:Uncharacterized protein n=1 Tax=Leucogyrophana mollusca TaxID=85980 RepID=A0ACB8BSN6_9AGAM|nr:hypothetical protein BV22DRAFT_1044904 [Leucogyrophana mollusca]
MYRPSGNWGRALAISRPLPGPDYPLACICVGSSALPSLGGGSTLPSMAAKFKDNTCRLVTRKDWYWISCSFSYCGDTPHRDIFENSYGISSPHIRLRHVPHASHTFFQCVLGMKSGRRSKSLSRSIAPPPRPYHHEMGTVHLISRKREGVQEVHTPNEKFQPSVSLSDTTSSRVWVRWDMGSLQGSWYLNRASLGNSGNRDYPRNTTAVDDYSFAALDTAPLDATNLVTMQVNKTDYISIPVIRFSIRID